MSSQTRLEGERFLTNKAQMFLWGLLMCTLMSGKIITSTKGLPTITHMIPLLQMDGINMHFHMRSLSEITMAIFAHPFFLAMMCGSNMSLE